jgi:hypothetical protein
MGKGRGPDRDEVMGDEGSNQVEREIAGQKTIR